jgi:hypothetical protein
LPVPGLAVRAVPTRDLAAGPHAVAGSLEDASLEDAPLPRDPARP